MKSKIKRHWRSVMSVVLAVCMLISCMTVGLIATDAARVNDEAVGGSDSTITDYKFKGAFDGWTEHYVNSEGKAFINIDTAGTYDFVVITGGGTQRRANKTFIESGSYNTSEDNTNFKITVTNPGTYTFQTTLIANSSVTVTVTFPSGGSTTSTDWRLVDGDCSWTAANSTKKFALNSSTGYYEYTQYFTGANYFRIYDGTNQYQGNTSGNYTITSGDNWTTLVSTTNDAFAFTPSTAGNYIVQVDASNKKIRIQEAAKYDVTCETPTNGTLTTSVDEAYAGNTVTITATPNTNYTLKSLVLTYDGVNHDVTNSVTGNSYTFTMPAFDVTATATFSNSKTIYFNNYVTQWSKVFVYTKNASGEEGNGASPGQEMTRLGESSIYQVEIPADSNYIVFTGSGGTNNKGGTITCNGSTIGNALPSNSSYNEYKATNTSSGASSTGTWSAHQGRSNVYTVTPGTSITGNDDLYYYGINATLYDYYTDGEYNNGTPNWIDGIGAYNSGQRTAEYSVDNGTEFKWNPYKNFNAALSSYASSNSVTYPLYFGNLNIRDAGSSEGYLEHVGRENSSKYTNWYYKINNSVNLKPDGASVTGLASSTESNSTIQHSSGDNMVMFNEDWLSRENSTGNPLATILHSSAFPVRKETKAAGTYYPNKIYVSTDNSKWGKDGAVIFAHFYNSNDTIQRDIMLTSDGTYLSCNIPTDFTPANVIFVRMPNGSTSLNWSTKWNQSSAYSLPTSDTDRSRLYTNTASGDNNVFSKGNIATSYGTIQPAYTYYEYDSTGGTDNAYIQNVNKTAQTATIEYSKTDKVYSADAGSGSSAGFFPFDNMKASDTSHTSDITNNNTGTSNRAHDLGFGMKVEIPFSLNANGTIDSKANGVAQTFNFSGDDDLWVFIDGKLVLDLGGAHKKAEGSIDFKNRTATSTTKVIAASSATDNSTTDLTATQTYSNDFSSWFNNTNPDVKHTMTLYYMERGMFDSNLKFNFSFHAISNLYSTEKKVRTKSVNSGFYEHTSQSIYESSGITKFERSYQDEAFNFDHKVSSTETGTYGYPAESFTYSKENVTWTTSGSTTTDSSLSYTAGNPLAYELDNDEKVNFIGKFTSGNYFNITESQDSNNLYTYTPRLTVYDDNDNSHKTTYPVTNVGNGSYRFRFDEPDTTGMNTVNVRAQFENEMNTHDLTVTKSIGDKTDTSTSFTFYITFETKIDGVSTGYIPYPLYASTSDPSNSINDPAQGHGQINDYGRFSIKAGETITFKGIPEGLNIRLVEDTSGMTNYTYGNMSAIGATATPDTSVTTQPGITMTMGKSNVSVTAKNNDNTVKATIRVKYAPSYYDFEHGTNITTDTYKPHAGSFEHITNTVACVTDFTDSSKTTTEYERDEMTETGHRDDDDPFSVEVTALNDGGKLFIGWYDKDGNRYNDTDATQHNTTATAPKDEDRVFEARFITAPTYRIDYDVPTRLWGNKIYKVFGTVNNSMITDNYIGYDSSRTSTATENQRYYLTKKLVSSNQPYEKVFLKSITWPDLDDGKTDTRYNVTKLVTSNTNTSKNVETTTGNVTYSMYRLVAAQVTDTRVSVDMFNDYSNLNTRSFQWVGEYGESVNNNKTVAVNIPADKTFYRWKIETLNSLGTTEITPNGTEVTYDYSPNFNYVVYDNYKVTAEFINKIGDKDYSPSAAKNADDPYHAYAPTNETTVINLGQTRSHWNETENGQVEVPATGESTSNTNANYNYDRMFIDLALSYSDGEKMLNKEENLNVGFIIQYQKSDNSWVDFKTVEFSSKKLGDKNRIEYYYGFQNAAGNRNAKFRVQPTIGGANSGTALYFDFSGSQFSSQTNY